MEALQIAVAALVAEASEISGRRGTTVRGAVVGTTEPTVLPTWLRQLAVEACGELGLDYRLLASQALRDAQVMNHLAPAGLVLVPSRKGASHVPDEWTSPVEIGRGVRLLAEWIVRLDRQLSKWRESER
jgi:acetylornithine deacetylase/succinyl-diaminopimelate desuccinylase-like protein